MLASIWEAVRPRLEAFGRVLGELAEVWYNMPMQCARCRQTFKRGEMGYLFDLYPPGSGHVYLFCPSCQVLVRKERAYAARAERERLRVVAHCERAMAAGLAATLTLEEWLRTLRFYHWRCAYCGAPYEHLEHFVPISKGGGTTAANCIPSCKRCNLLKRDALPDEIGESSRSPSAIARVRAYLLSIQGATLVSVSSATFPAMPEEHPQSLLSSEPVSPQL